MEERTEGGRKLNNTKQKRTGWLWPLLTSVIHAPLIAVLSISCLLSPTQFYLLFSPLSLSLFSPSLFLSFSFSKEKIKQIRQSMEQYVLQNGSYLGQRSRFSRILCVSRVQTTHRPLVQNTYNYTNSVSMHFPHVLTLHGENVLLPVLTIMKPCI